MKILSVPILILSLILAGCGRKEEAPDASAAEEAAEAVATPPSAATTPASETATAPEGSMTDIETGLVAASKSAEEKVKGSVQSAMDEYAAKSKAQAEQSVEDPDEPALSPQMSLTEMQKSMQAAGETAGESVETEGDTVASEVAAPEVESVVAEPVMPATEEPSSPGLLTGAAALAGSMAGTLDLSWDKVAEVPYSDKEQLAAWAMTEARAWQDKLTAAAKEKGLSTLEGLGDSGWQGQLKSVLGAIEGVREASPETWDTARSALVTAWDSFKAEASNFLGEE